QGVAGLGAGTRILLKGGNDERMFVEAGPSQALGGRGVDNQGKILAAQAELKAAGGNMYALAVNNGGVIRATGAVNKAGRVILSSDGGVVRNSGLVSAQNHDQSGGKIVLKSNRSSQGSASKVVNEGVLEATGVGSGTKGGSITLTADEVRLAQGSLIDVS